jgi:ABC-type transport system involved in multi-copper enzyme maturation permease subunit
VHMVSGTPTRRSVLTESAWRMWRPEIGSHAMIWKELFAEQAISGLGVIGRVVIAFLFLGIMAPVGWQYLRVMQGLMRPEDFQVLITVLTTVIGSLFLLVLSARAATSVTIEKERQTWETLISTPLTAWEIVIGKTLGNVYALRWLLILMGILWGMAALVRPWVLGSAMLMIGTLSLLSAFFVGMGLFLSLRSRTSTRAMCWSMLISLLVGGGYLLCAAPLTSLMIASGLISRHQEEIILAASVPYLLAWTGMEELHRSNGGLSAAIFSVFVLTYFVFGVCLFLNSVTAFDRIAGRPSRRVWLADRELDKVVVLVPKEPLRFPSNVTS